MDLEFNSLDAQREAASSPYLLQGLIFDSAGNRMTPSHCRKKGCATVIKSLIQRREQEAGKVARVPAPEVEALVWKAWPIGWPIQAPARAGRP